MHRVAYIFPLIAANILLVLFRNYDQWWIYLIMVVVTEFFLWLIMRRVSRTKEYLSGYARHMEHHEPWVERVERVESYTDSRGNTRTRVVVDYVHHPDLWLMVLNTGRVVVIHHNVYYHYCSLWKTPEQWINPPHPNCVSGGGGQRHNWDGLYQNAATCTYQGLYINYVNNSNSIFRKDYVSRREARDLGLIKYPKYDRGYIEQDVVLCSPRLPLWIRHSESPQRAFQLINAIYGAQYQIHIFVLLFDASQGVGVALKQQSYWKGGNKNEFVVCLGVDYGDIPQSMLHDRKATVKWCKAFSWCDAPTLESATESWFIANSELRLDSYAAWLRDHMGLWKRKEFSDFKYLGVTLSSGRQAVVAVVTTLFCLTMIVITCAVADANRRQDYYQDNRDYTGYGYTLLDKYILKNRY